MQMKFETNNSKYTPEFCVGQLHHSSFGLPPRDYVLIILAEPPARRTWTSQSRRSQNDLDTDTQRLRVRFHPARAAMKVSPAPALNLMTQTG